MKPHEFKADQEFWEKVHRAEAMTPMERILEGLRLFEVEKQAVAQSFRERFPEATDQKIQDMVAEEYRVRKEKEDAEIYFPVFIVDAPSSGPSPSF